MCHPRTRRITSTSSGAGCLSGTPSGLRLQGLHPVTVSAVPFSASAATSDYFTQGLGAPPTVVPPGRVAALDPRGSADRGSGCGGGRRVRAHRPTVQRSIDFRRVGACGRIHCVRMGRQRASRSSCAVSEGLRGSGAAPAAPRAAGFGQQRAAAGSRQRAPRAAGRAPRAAGTAGSGCRAARAGLPGNDEGHDARTHRALGPGARDRAATRLRRAARRRRRSPCRGCRGGSSGCRRR
ncbi:hypothetical protein EDF27_3835 [Curtobacterium sp. PhB136]|nr:hypothetical protein EDF27_3835 [Curtobacterium sp. PhB136]